VGAENSAAPLTRPFAFPVRSTSRCHLSGRRVTKARIPSGILARPDRRASVALSICRPRRPTRTCRPRRHASDSSRRMSDVHHLPRGCQRHSACPLCAHATPRKSPGQRSDRVFGTHRLRHNATEPLPQCLPLRGLRDQHVGHHNLRALIRVRRCPLGALVFPACAARLPRWMLSAAAYIDSWSPPSGALASANTATAAACVNDVEM
jgi:hypothetical protein